MGTTPWYALTCHERPPRMQDPPPAHAPDLALDNCRVVVACLKHARPTLHCGDPLALRGRGDPAGAADAGWRHQPERVRPARVPGVRFRGQSRPAAGGELPEGLAQPAQRGTHRFAAPAPCRPRRLGQPVPEPQAVPPAAGAVAGLKLTLVTSPQQRRTWNELVASEHPQGAVLHVGAQVRYLIESEHGLLGALGFAAAALAVAARDEWIGWDAQLRRKRLHRVLGLSRFLIRPSVRCHLLASKVLGMVRRRLPEDFLQRYGYRPALLETYCDPQQHAGTCFRAANWTCVGQTGGRGRFARPGQRACRQQGGHLRLPPAARLAAPARGRRSTARPAAGAGRRAGPDVRAQRTGPGAAG